MGKYIELYMEQDARKLKQIIDGILKTKFAWMPMIYYDDVYSIGEIVVWQCEEKYDETKNKDFNKWLKFCLERKIKTYITHINREKRSNKDKTGKRIADISIDTPINENGDYLGDILVGETDIGYCDSDAVTEYLSTLSTDAKKVLKLLVEGYNKREIREKLGYSERRVSDLIRFMKAPRRVKILRR